jgi:hypothetical protein
MDGDVSLAQLAAMTGDDGLTLSDVGASYGNPMLMKQLAKQRAANKRPNVTDVLGYGLDWSSYLSNLSRNFAGQFEGLGTPQNFMGPFGFGGITAFHGSPHKFDKFDMSKVGTGEGAQAYGHGLYFAENPQVAKGYQESVSNLHGIPTKVEGGGKSVPIPQWLGNEIDKSGIDAAISKWAERAKEQRVLASNSQQPWIHEGNAARLEADLEVMKQIKSSGQAKVATPGNLYKVDIPDDQVAKMLDWDAPLSKQPENVRAFIERAMKATPEEIRGASEGFGPFGDLGATALAAIRRGDIKTGADLVNYVGNGPAGTNILRASGIPGIKYLDQGSRSGGKGTSNFVVFDDQIPKILSRE